MREASLLNRVRELLSDDARVWGITAVLVGLLAALKGLRLPGAWALTQAQLDYSTGFIKRGLLGTVFSAAHLSQQVPLTITFFAELALFFGVLALFTRHSGLISRFGSAAIVALAVGSFAVTFLFHIVGYSDIPNATIAASLLMVRNPRTRFLIALPCFALALLIHENFLFLFAPLVLFSFFLHGIKDRQQRRSAWTYGFALALLAGGITAATSLRKPLPDEQIQALADRVEARADFSVRDDFFWILGHSPSDNFAEVRDLGWRRYLWWTNQAVSLCVLLPVLLLLLHFSHRLIRSALPPDTLAWTYAALLASVFSPLAMHALGIDAVRWNTWIVVNAFMALCLLCLQLPGAPQPLSTGERNLILLAIILSVASGHGLFDGEQINPYPFFPKALAPVIIHHDGPIPGF